MLAISICSSHTTDQQCWKMFSKGGSKGMFFRGRKGGYAQCIPDLGDTCDLPVVTMWLAGWGRGENGQDMTFEWEVIGG